MAKFSFPGITNWTQVSYSFGHGITPGVITVEVPANTCWPAQEGTAILDSIRLDGCRVDSGSSRIGGGNRWTFAILDWRWKWRFGSISGVYNQRDGAGKLKKDTEKTPRELAEMLLDEMQVSKRNIGAMPNTHRPEVNWSFQNPAASLADLAEQVGCRVVPHWDQSVSILPAGQGDSLPDGPSPAIEISLDTGEIPSGVKVVGATARIQARWKLEAVGRDTDGKWKPVDDLSYAVDWTRETPGFLTSIRKDENAKIDKRALAVSTVYFAYRIKELKAEGKIPGVEIDAKSIERKQCLPIMQTLAETWEDPTTKETAFRPAVVRGSWTKNEPGGNTVENETYAGRLSFDAEAGVVLFDQPMFRIDGNAFKFADITLEVGFPIHKDATSGPYRPYWRHDIQPRNDVGDAILRADELQYVVRQTYGSDGTPIEWKDNRETDELDKAGEDLAKRYAAGLETKRAGQRHYAGIVPQRLDGAIGQVSWSLGANGARTTISRNSEHDTDIIPSYKRRREIEKAATK